MEIDGVEGVTLPVDGEWHRESQRDIKEFAYFA